MRRPSSPITVRRIGEDEPIAIVSASTFASKAPSVVIPAFSVEQVRGILTTGSRFRAFLVKPGAVVRRRVQPLRRRVGRDGETVVEKLSKRLTIVAVSEPMALTELSSMNAEDFGHASIDDLLDAWRSAHPRITTVRIVRFNVGDTRDLPRLLRRRGGRVGRENLDYTANPANALPGEGEAFSDGKE